MTASTTITRKSFQTICSVYLLLFHEEKILFSRRKNTGYEDGNYGLVSGHVEQGEALRAAAARETEEEIGLLIAPDNIELTLVMHRFAPSSNPPERLDFFMTAKLWEGQPLNNEPDKCSALNWFHVNNLPANTIPYIRHAIEQIEAKISYCEYGWDYSCNGIHKH